MQKKKMQVQVQNTVNSKRADFILLPVIPKMSSSKYEF